MNSVSMDSFVKTMAAANPGDIRAWFKKLKEDPSVSEGSANYQHLVAQIARAFFGNEAHAVIECEISKAQLSRAERESTFCPPLAGAALLTLKRSTTVSFDAAPVVAVDIRALTPNGGEAELKDLPASDLSVADFVDLTMQLMLHAKANAPVLAGYDKEFQLQSGAAKMAQSIASHLALNAG